MLTAVPSAFLWFVVALALVCSSRAATVVIGVIGDYGSGTTNEEAVANLVKSWNPDFIMTVGDNNYPYGEATTIDKNVGQFYHDYIYPYLGTYGAGAVTNRFFPTVGNHDCCFPAPTPTGYDPYLAYFTLPGNERYYNYRYGPVEIFCLNSNPNDPDGWTFDSVQGEWLRTSLAASTATWRLVYCHHSPYSSGALHGTSTGQGYFMQWPFKQWGATALITGHDHIYERMLRDGMTYMLIGIGGDRLDPYGTLDPYSQVRYNATYGALRIDATETNILFRAINKTNSLIDTLTFEALPARLQLINWGPPTQLRLFGSTGQSYVTEASANLTGWTAVSTNLPVAGSVIVTDSSSSAFQSRFYRARLGP
jgi:tartrate-resistant acid phosphatase type 5